MGPRHAHETDRAFYAPRWRMLAQACAATDLLAIQPIANEAQDWRTPLTGKGPSWALFSLARLAKAFAVGTRAEQEAMVPALMELGKLALGYLAEEGPPQPQLPFRRDLDG